MQSRPIPTVLGLVLAVLLSACAGGEETATQPSPSPTVVEQTATEVPEKEEVTVDPSPETIEENSQTPEPTATPQPTVTEAPAPTPPAPAVPTDVSDLNALHDAVVAAISAQDVSTSLASISLFPADLALPEDSVLRTLSIEERIQPGSGSVDASLVNQIVPTVLTSTPLASLQSMYEAELPGLGWEARNGYATTTLADGTTVITASFDKPDQAFGDPLVETLSLDITALKDTDLREVRMLYQAQETTDVPHTAVFAVAAGFPVPEGYFARSSDLRLSYGGPTPRLNYSASFDGPAEDAERVAQVTFDALPAGPFAVEDGDVVESSNITQGFGFGLVHDPLGEGQVNAIPNRIGDAGTSLVMSLDVSFEAPPQAAALGLDG